MATMAQQPRERMLSLGIQALGDAELLALLWGHGSNGHSAIALADRLLKCHESLALVCQLNHREFTQHHGLGLAKFGQLQAALELSRRFWRHRIDRRPVMEDYSAIGRLLITELRHHREEVFAAVFLDTQQRFIFFEKLFTGGLDRAYVFPRTLVERCLVHNAASIILAHNHPSGCDQPSNADLAITHSLRDTLARLDISLMDHIIVAGNKARSLCLTQQAASGIKTDLFSHLGDRDV